MSAPQQPNSVQYTHTHTTCVSAAHSATNRRPHTAHVSLLIGGVLFSPRDLESDWSRRLSVTVAPPPRFVWKGCWFFRSLVAAVGWSRCARAGAFLLIYFSSFDSIPPLNSATVPPERHTAARSFHLQCPVPVQRASKDGGLGCRPARGPRV